MFLMMELDTKKEQDTHITLVCVQIDLSHACHI